MYNFVQFISTFLLAMSFSANVLAKTGFVALSKFRQGVDKYSDQFKEVVGSGVSPLAQCKHHDFEVYHLGKKSVGGKTKLVVLKQNEPDEAQLTQGAVLTISKDDATNLNASRGPGDLSEPNQAQVSVNLDQKAKKLTFKSRRSEAFNCKKIAGKTLKDYAQTSDDEARVHWECSRDQYDGKFILAQLEKSKPRLWIIRSWDISQYEFPNINLEKGALDNKVETVLPNYQIAPKGTQPQTPPAIKKVTYYKMKDSKFTEDIVEEVSGIPCDQNK